MMKKETFSYTLVEQIDVVTLEYFSVILYVHESVCVCAVYIQFPFY